MAHYGEIQKFVCETDIANEMEYFSEARMLCETILMGAHK